MPGKSRNRPRGFGDFHIDGNGVNQDQEGRETN